MFHFPFKGSFGVVYEVKNKETQEKFAIKMISKEKVSFSSNYLFKRHVYEALFNTYNYLFLSKIKVGGGKYAVSFENEVYIMKSVIHPNLIKLEEVFESKKKLYLITELCEAGELAKWIKKAGPIPEPISKIIMRQIVDAISYLHKNGKAILIVFSSDLKFPLFVSFLFDRKRHCAS